MCSRRLEVASTGTSHYPCSDAHNTPGGALTARTTPAGLIERVTTVTVESHGKARDGVFEQMSGHEQVVYCNDEATGLQAIIAIYSTALGPALGGTRFYPYATDRDALLDVLNL